MRNVAEEVLGRQSVVAETNARDTQLGKDLRSKFTNEQLVRKLKNAKGAEKNAIEDILIDETEPQLSQVDEDESLAYSNSK